MTTTTYFDIQIVSYSAAGTNVDRSTSESEIPASNLNLPGTLTIVAGKNAISGAVITAGGVSDNANSKPYGPTANKVVGTYVVPRANLGSNVGRFWGQR